MQIMPYFRIQSTKKLIERITLYRNVEIKNLVNLPNFTPKKRTIKSANSTERITPYRNVETKNLVKLFLMEL